MENIIPSEWSKRNKADRNYSIALVGVLVLMVVLAIIYLNVA